jgi:hypothetical protein
MYVSKLRARILIQLYVHETLERAHVFRVQVFKTRLYKDVASRARAIDFDPF